jgi:cytosol aminopeptidase
MSTKVFILPIDPTAPGSQSAVPNLDTAKLWSKVPVSKKTPKAGTTRVFYDVPSGGSNVTALVSLGDRFAKQKGDGKREVVRKAVGSAVKDVKALVEGETTVSVDASADPHATGNLCMLSSNYFSDF